MTGPRRRLWAGGPRPASVRFEQAVYGSFAFRDDGYAMLAESPGCRPEWLADFRAACQKLGERPSGAADAPSLFALRLPSGPWAVVGVIPQGRDDRGRPGALAFHGLFLAPGDYARAGADPFALASALRSDWSAETHALAAGVWSPGPTVEPPADPRSGPIAAALAAGRRVALEAPGPVDDLARQVWRALPERVRARASVATWAFGNGNGFDLLAVPRLSGVALGASYVDPASPAAVDGAGGGGAPPSPAGPPLWRAPRALAALGLAVVLAGVGVGLSLRGDGDGDDLPGPEPRAARPEAPPPPADDPPPPDPPAGPDDDDPAERRRVAGALAGLADRFGVDPGGDPEPAALMEELSRAARYTGPFLSDAERERLARDPGPDAALALRWDALARRFAADRPLPDDFRARSLRGQLGALAWSFHCGSGVVRPAGPRRSASEVAQALAESLTVDAPLRPTPLAERYPALTPYRAFLDRLPRR